MLRPRITSRIWAIKKAVMTTIKPMRAWVRVLVAPWILAGSPAAVRKEKPAMMSWTKKTKPAPMMAYWRRREAKTVGRPVGLVKRVGL